LYSGDLTKHIPRSSCLRERDRLQVAIAELVSAVEHLHGVGIMHRDIKPNNVFISNDGHVALGDFGLAHVTP
ncbi:kinase-like domain-containing protein, partial [Irpex rosettiformis]